MKNLLMTLVLVSLSLVGQSQSLVGHWPLDGNFNDVSPWTNIGTPVGAPIPVLDRFNNVNGAMYFGQTPTGDYVEIAQLPSITAAGQLSGFGPYTIILWANLTGINNEDVLFTLGIEDVTQANPFQMAFEVFNNNLILKSGTMMRYSVVSNSVVPTNTWVQLAVVFDGTNHTVPSSFKFYVNANVDTVLPNINTNGMPVATVPYPLGNGAKIGKCAGALLNGSLDDIRIYNYALSDSQITTLYTSGSVGLNEYNKFESSVFPNPSNDFITIKSETLFSTLLITDMAGRKILNTTVNDTQSVIDVKSFTPGVYTLQLVDRSGARSQRKFMVN
jgi:hypothetical protein